MPLFIWQTIKTFSTNFTCIGLFTRMYYHMSIFISYIRKTSSTYFTCIRLFTRMYYHMSLFIFCISKTFFAYLTFPWFCGIQSHLSFLICSIKYFFTTLSPSNSIRLRLTFSFSSNNTTSYLIKFVSSMCYDAAFLQWKIN